MNAHNLKIAQLAEELQRALYGLAVGLGPDHKVERENIVSDARIVERIAVDAARRYADAFAGASK